MNNQQGLLEAKDEQIADLRERLAKKDDVIKEEVARRVKELAAKDVAISNEAKRRERELAAIRNELAAKDKQVLLCNL